MFPAPFLMVQVLLVDGVNLLVLHVLLLKVRVGKVEEGAGAQHAADSALVQLTRLGIVFRISRLKINMKTSVVSLKL